MANKDFTKEFESIYKKHIKREGADKLLEWLKGTDFFTAPASTKHHSNFAGGLVEHSVLTYQRFRKLLEQEYGAAFLAKDGMEESAAIIALLHDVCKTNYYKTEMRNVKENGAWVQKPVFVVDDQLPYGHGEKSVYMLGGFMRLNRDEAMAINWHMGAFDSRNSGFAGGQQLSSAFQKYPLALMFHVADLLTTYLDERIIK